MLLQTSVIVVFTSPYDKVYTITRVHSAGCFFPVRRKPSFGLLECEEKTKVETAHQVVGENVRPQGHVLGDDLFQNVVLQQRYSCSIHVTLVPRRLRIGCIHALV